MRELKAAIVVLIAILAITMIIIDYQDSNTVTVDPVPTPTRFKPDTFKPLEKSVILVPTETATTAPTATDAPTATNTPTQVPTPLPTVTAVPTVPPVPTVACVIKGNVAFDDGEKIYHVPGGEYYDATVINSNYGERWFCSESEAQAAGWRRSYK